MLKICIVLRKPDPHYAYKRYGYIKKHVTIFGKSLNHLFNKSFPLAIVLLDLIATLDNIYQAKVYPLEKDTKG